MKITDVVLRFTEAKLEQSFTELLTQEHYTHVLCETINPFLHGKLSFNDHLSLRTESKIDLVK
jgi:hypothetical protein